MCKKTVIPYSTEREVDITKAQARLELQVCNSPASAFRMLELQVCTILKIIVASEKSQKQYREFFFHAASLHTCVCVCVCCSIHSTTELYSLYPLVLTSYNHSRIFKMKKLSLLKFYKINRLVVNFTSFFSNNILFVFQDPIHEATLQLGVSDIYVCAAIDIHNPYCI